MSQAWKPHEDELFLLRDAMGKCQDLGGPDSQNLEKNYIDLKILIKRSEINLQPDEQKACIYYQHINLATLNRLWQSSVAFSLISTIIKGDCLHKAQELGYQLFLFTISAHACFSLLLEGFKCLKDSEPRVFKNLSGLFKDHQLKKSVREFLVEINQNTQELEQLHTLRDEIVHLFLPGSALFNPANNLWLLPKPDLQNFKKFCKELIESNRDEWFAKNPDNSVSIEIWTLTIMSWLVKSISNGWGYFARSSRRW